MKFKSVLSIVIALVLLCLVHDNASAQNVFFGDIYAIDWSPDGTKIAVGGGESPCDLDPENYAIHIFNASDQSVIRTLIGHTCEVYSVRWSPDGTKLASFGWDESGVRIWDAETGELLTSAPFPPAITSISWSPDSSKISVTTIGNVLHMVDATTGERLLLSEGGGTWAAWSPMDASILMASTYSSAIDVLDAKTSEIRLSVDNPSGSTLYAAWSSKGDRFITISDSDNLIRIWDAETGLETRTVTTGKDKIIDAAWSPDSKRIATAHGEEGVRIWDTDSGDLLNTIRYAGSVFAVDWSPDGKNLAYGGTRDDINAPEIMISEVQDHDGG